MDVTDTETVTINLEGVNLEPRAVADALAAIDTLLTSLEDTVV